MLNKKGMNQYLSIKISNLQLICAILIISIHSNSLMFNLPGKQEVSYVYGKNYASFIQLFICEGIARMAVPFFYISAGFLFFYGFKPILSNFVNKYKKRFFSYVVPYVFWSFATFAFYYIVQLIPFFENFFKNDHVVGCSFLQAMDYIFINPLSAIGFLRNLIVLVAVSPLVYLVVKYFWCISLPLVYYLWIIGADMKIVVNDSVLFFLLGAFIAIKIVGDWQLEKILFTRNSKTVSMAFVVIWLVILTIKSLYLCSLPYTVLLYGDYPIALKNLNIINIVVGLAAVWFGYDLIFNKAEKYKRSKYCKYGIMLFALHHPIVRCLKKVLYMLFGASLISSVLVLILTVVLSFIVIILFSKLLERIMPKFYKLVSGGR